MKSYLITAALCVAVHAAASGPVWIETVHDFGAFREELGKVYCTFEAINTSDAPIVVVNARANCGCTTPKYPLEAIAPGDTLKVSVAYDASGRPGRFEKRIYVNTSDGTSSTLRVRGTVIGAQNSLEGRYPVKATAARLSTTVLPFGEVLKGKIGAADIRGYNTTGDTIYPGVENVPSYIDIRIRPQAVPPGEQFVISATATTDRCKKWGFVTDSLSILPDTRTDAEPVTASTIVIVREDFSRLTPGQREKAPHCKVTPHSLDFGRFNRTDAEATLSFVIENTGKSTLEIRDITTPESALTIKNGTRSIKKGKKTTITVTFNPVALGNAELLNARITIITNDPQNPVQMIRTVGEPIQ